MKKYLVGNRDCGINFEIEANSQKEAAIKFIENLMRKNWDMRWPQAELAEL